MAVPAPTPEVSVVVASHGRAAYVPRLLDALAGQTLARERWELVVAHTYSEDMAAVTLGGHELARDGTLRQVPVDPARARPSVQRNAGWRAARGRLIAFTDDDCRPEHDWLERLAERHEPGAIVQGATFPDPLDGPKIDALYVRTLKVEDPPNEATQTCNILYERELLERVDGFDEAATTGEDIDLALRSQRAGARVVGARDAVVYHAVEELSLADKVASNQKWQHLAYVVKRNPELRERCLMGVWWKSEHLGALVALGAVLAAPRRPAALLGVAPFYWTMRDRFGPTPRGRVRTLKRLPQLWLVEIAELGTFVRGSVRYRTLLL